MRRLGLHLRLESNPAVGSACDMLVAEGGTVILSETPELIGAEHILARTSPDAGIAHFSMPLPGGKKRPLWGRHPRGQPFPGQHRRRHNNPGRKVSRMHPQSRYKPAEECHHADPPTKKGLVFMDTPAHDIEQLTGMAAGGAQDCRLYHRKGTRRGSPIAPVIKITANRNTYLTLRDIHGCGYEQNHEWKRNTADSRKTHLRRNHRRGVRQDHKSRTVGSE